jgi:hypothetical protein
MTGRRRISWAKLPSEIVNSLEGFLGSRVVAATDQPGGFSDGVATRLHRANRRRVFIKAVNSGHAPEVAAFHRREITIASAMPATAPVHGCSTPTTTAPGWLSSSRTSTGHCQPNPDGATISTEYCRRPPTSPRPSHRHRSTELSWRHRG